MKTIYLVAGLFVMLIQGSWQRSLQDTEEKSSSFPAPQTDPLNDPDQINEDKRHSQGTFTSDYSKYLDSRRAQDFVRWLMNTKRNKSNIAKRHDEFERHAEGTFTSDVSSYLEGQAAKEFIAWLVKGRGRRDFPEEVAIVEELGRRHADGSFSDEMNTVLDTLATRDFINWLLQTKITEWYRVFDQGDSEGIKTFENPIGPLRANALRPIYNETHLQTQNHPCAGGIQQVQY